MKKIIFAIFIIFAVITILILRLPKVKIGNYVKIDNTIFYIEIAKTDWQKEKGLAIYNKLAINKGMLFPFEKPSYYTFWMKDMKFPIDIIYIRNNKIVDIFENVPPPKSPLDSLPIYKPKQPADMVLEINAGLSDKYNFKDGDYTKINF